jgi:transcriptional regulator with XRE-family HTH domain
MAKNKALPQDVVDRVKRVVTTQIREKYGGVQRAYAEGVEISTAALNDFLNDRRGIGTVFLMAVAKDAGLSLDELLTGESGGGSHQTVEACIYQLAEAEGIPTKHVEDALKVNYSDGGKRTSPLDRLNLARYMWDVAQGRVRPPTPHEDGFISTKPKGLPNKKR